MLGIVLTLGTARGVPLVEREGSGPSWTRTSRSPAGGINAALCTLDADSWQQHAADTLEETYLLADPRTGQIVPESARAAIAALMADVSMVGKLLE